MLRGSDVSIKRLRFLRGVGIVNRLDFNFFYIISKERIENVVRFGGVEIVGGLGIDVSEGFVSDKNTTSSWGVGLVGEFNFGGSTIALVAGGKSVTEERATFSFFFILENGSGFVFEFLKTFEESLPRTFWLTSRKVALTRIAYGDVLSMPLKQYFAKGM